MGDGERWKCEKCGNWQWHDGDTPAPQLPRGAKQDSTFRSARGPPGAAATIAAPPSNTRGA
eukprot:gene36374-64435_t